MLWTRGVSVMSMLMGEVRVEEELSGVVGVNYGSNGSNGSNGANKSNWTNWGLGASGCRGGRVSVDLPVAPTARYWVAVFAAGCAGCRGERKLARCSLAKRDYCFPRVTVCGTRRQESTRISAFTATLSLGSVGGTIGSSGSNTPVPRVE